MHQLLLIMAEKKEEFNERPFVYEGIADLR